MHVNELYSFVQKFNQLWKAGFTAHLDIDSHNGNAWVGLRLQLGHPSPNQPPQYVPPSSSRNRGPSYRRRLERRRVARFQATSSPEPTAEVRDDKNNGNSEAEKANTEHENEVEDSTEEVEEMLSSVKDRELTGDHDSHELEQRDAEKANLTGNFDCLICDFSSPWSNGLKVHMSRVHTKLEQLDGCVDDITTEQDKKYANTAHYWERGHIGIAYHSYLDATKIIDDCEEISDEEKAEEKTKLLESRKAAFGRSFENFPPWKLR